MHVDARKAGQTIIVDLQGRLVAGTGDEVLREVMNEVLGSRWNQIVLNLSEVTKIDSSGIGELVSSIKLGSRFGASVKLLNVSGPILEILRLSQLLPHLDIYHDEEEALASFGDEESRDDEEAQATPA